MPRRKEEPNLPKFRIRDFDLVEIRMFEPVDMMVLTASEPRMFVERIFLEEVGKPSASKILGGSRTFVLLCAVLQTEHGVIDSPISFINPPQKLREGAKVRLTFAHRGPDTFEVRYYEWNNMCNWVKVEFI